MGATNAKSRKSRAQRSNTRSETKSKITAPTIFKDNDNSIDETIADEIITREDLKEIVDQLNAK